MNFLILDDEKYARLRLQRLLYKSYSASTICEAEDPITARKIIKNSDIDLLFLDINLPYMTGIEFLKSLERKPYTIFITAHQEHALDAFNLDAIDFLLKPYNEERFLKSIEKAQLFLEKKNTLEIRVKEGSKTHYINVNDITTLQSDGNYVTINLKSDELLIRGSLKSIISELPSNDFIKVNRSTVINKNKIKSIEPLSHGEKCITLITGKTVKVSRTHKVNL